MTLDNLRISIDDVMPYSLRYSYGPENLVSDLVLGVKQRGFLTKAELTVLGEWKSARIRSRLAKNSETMVQEVTGLMLSTRSIRLAVHIPQALTGVGMPVASTLLHWFHVDAFPILDFRALWSLGIDIPTFYTLDFWDDYVKLVRLLAAECGVDMRTLDRALWQFSADHQPVA